MKRNYKKLMVIGSGPIVIGQAAEFDFSGSRPAGLYATRDTIRYW